MDNMVDLYYELSKFSEQGNLREGWCHDLAKWLSYYLYFFSFTLGLLHKKECRKVLYDKKSWYHIT